MRLEEGKEYIFLKYVMASAFIQWIEIEIKNVIHTVKVEDCQHGLQKGETVVFAGLYENDSKLAEICRRSPALVVLARRKREGK